MKLIWYRKSIADLARLYEFLVVVNPKAAMQVIFTINKAVEKLAQHPRLGEKIEHYSSREVRRLIIGNYELRYEIQSDCIYILRLWHTREKR